MLAVTVEFTIDPVHWKVFMPLMRENARRSLEDEPGCHQFDVCVDDARPGVVFLYELYEDRAAFDAHLASAHFKAFSAATQAMIVGRVIGIWRRADA